MFISVKKETAPITSFLAGREVNDSVVVLGVVDVIFVVGRETRIEVLFVDFHTLVPH